MGNNGSISSDASILGLHELLPFFIRLLSISELLQNISPTSLTASPKETVSSGRFFSSVRKRGSSTTTSLSVSEAYSKQRLIGCLIGELGCITACCGDSEHALLELFMVIVSLSPSTRGRLIACLPVPLKINVLGTLHESCAPFVRISNLRPNHG